MAGTTGSGGPGGDAAPPPAGGGAGGIRTTRLYARAVAEGWPLNDSVRTGVLRYLVRVVEGLPPEDLDDELDGIPEEALGADPDDKLAAALSRSLRKLRARPGHRERLAAAKALIAVGRLNLETLRTELSIDDAGGDGRVDGDLVERAEAIREGRRGRPPDEAG